MASFEDEGFKRLIFRESDFDESERQNAGVITAIVLGVVPEFIKILS